MPLNPEQQTQPDQAPAELLADAVLRALPDRVAGMVSRSQVVTECSRLPDTWTVEALTAAVIAGPWGDARTGGRVIAWLRDQAHRSPRPPSTPSGPRCPNTDAPMIADGSCCGLDHGDVARSA